MPELRGYQRDGVSYLKAARSAYLGDPVGTGKSTVALHAIQESGALPCIVVMPASMKLVWREEILKWLPAAKVHVVANGRDGIPKGVEWVLVNYDRLDARMPDLLAVGHKSIVLDEAAYIKNGAAKRSKAAKVLAWKCGVRYLLSATPVLNRPEELIHPLTVMGRFREVATDWLDYVTKFCAAKRIERGYGSFWDTTGSSNEALLHDLLFNSQLGKPPVMLRRKKEDVLPELPTDTEVMVPVELSNAKEYQMAETEFKRWLIAEKLSKVAGVEDMGEEELSELVFRLSQTGDPSQAVKVAKLRQVVARGKLDAAERWLKDFDEGGGGKVVIFVHHREGVTELARRLGPQARSIMGGDSDIARFQAISDFQKDASVKFIVCSIKAAGVGITLTAASTCLFIETTYTPSDVAQARGRINRIGQLADKTVSYYLTAPGTVDRGVWAKLLSKTDTITKIVGGVG